MHRLQQHILQQLIFNDSRRYSQLKPANVESNLFVYHLRQLISEGLVAKLDDGHYALTPAGQAYADRLSLASFRPRLQPRIVTLIVINRGDDILMYRRKRQPLLGMVGFPYGKVHVGESVGEGARRELKEKAGLEADMTHRGDGYITMKRNEEVISEILFHLFAGNQARGELIKSTTAGEAFWAKPADIPATELMPSVPDLLKAIQSPERFFVELNYQL